MKHRSKDSNHPLFVFIQLGNKLTTCAGVSHLLALLVLFNKPTLLPHQSFVIDSRAHHSAANPSYIYQYFVIVLHSVLVGWHFEPTDLVQTFAVFEYSVLVDVSGYGFEVV